MRGKRSKQYRKLMHAYSLAFNFREPYQVLLTPDTIQTTCRFKMDLPHLLSRTLHGEIKPMITECAVRHLYSSHADDRAEKSAWIEVAKGCERRRCGHGDSEAPLEASACAMSVIDPKGSGGNKHRYIVATQDEAFRKRLRQIPGVPLVYVQRSVMVMEPMGRKSDEVRSGLEEDKVRSGVSRGKVGDKRKREEEEGEAASADGDGEAAVAADLTNRKKSKKGPKAPNPLSVKKAKKFDGNDRGKERGSEIAIPDRMAKQIREAREQAKKEKAEALSRKDKRITASEAT